MTNLERLRLNARMTVDELAIKANVSSATIRRAEHRQADLRDENLFKLAKALECEPVELKETHRPAAA